MTIFKHFMRKLRNHKIEGERRLRGWAETGAGKKRGDYRDVLMGVGAPVEDMMMPAGFGGRGMSLHNEGQSRIKAQVLSRYLSTEKEQKKYLTFMITTVI
jgi:hypothetical protein